MAEIDNLNFKLILDDKDFNAAVEAATKKARELNTSVSTLLNLTKRVSEATGAGAKARIDEAKAIAAEEKALQQMAQEQQKTLKATHDAALAQQKVATETQKTAKVQNEAAIAANKVAQEQQKIATQTARTNEIVSRTANAQQQAATRQLILQEKLQQAQMRTADVINRQTQSVRSQTKAWESQIPVLKAIAKYAGSYFSIRTVQRFVSELVRVTGEFEKQQVAIRTIVQDNIGADKLFSQIKDLAVESPFSVLDLTSYAKQLSAFSVPLNELYDTTKMLADVAAGLGVSMDRIILAYGQVRAATYLRGQEVRQFTEAGIPIYEEIAKQLSVIEGRMVKAAEVADYVSKRKVSFEMVKQAFVDMTSAGGKFYNMQGVLADTLAGKLEKIKDQFQIALSELGNSNSGVLHGIADTTLRLLKHYEAIGRAIVGIVVAYGTWKAIALVPQILESLRYQLTLIRLLTRDLKGMAKAQALFNSVCEGNPYVKIAQIILTVGTSIIAMMSFMKDKQEEINNGADDVRSKFELESASAKKLMETIKDTTKSQDERNAAISQFNVLFSPYLDNLITEKTSVEELDEAYKKVSNTLANDFLRGMKDTELEPARKAQVDSLNKVRDTVTEYLKNARYVSEEEKKIVVNNAVAMVARGEDMNQVLKTVIAQVERLEKSQDWTYLGTDVYRRRFNGFKKDLEDVLEAAFDAQAGFVALSTSYEDFKNKLLGNSNTGEGSKIAKSNEQIKKEIDDLKERRKELKELAKKGGPEWTNDLQAELNQSEQRLDALKKQYKINTGIDLEEGRKGGDTKSQKERRLALDNEYSSIKNVNDAYEKLLSFFDNNDDKAKNALALIGYDKDLIDKNYAAEVERLAAAYEKIGTAQAKAKAQELRNSIKKDDTKSYIDGLRAFEKYKTTMDSWLANIPSIDGKKVEEKISKIVSDVATKNNKVDLDAKKLKEQWQAAVKGSNEAIKKSIIDEYGEAFWKEYYEKGGEAVDKLAERIKEANKQSAQNTISSLADAYATEMTKDLDLGDWGDKSLSQIDGIIDKLIKKRKELLPQDIIEVLEKAGIEVKDFYEAYKKLLNAKIGTAIDEDGKKIVKTVKIFQKPIESLGKTLSGIGKDTKDIGLYDLGETVQHLGSSIPTLAEFASALQRVSERIKAAVGLSEEEAKKMKKLNFDDLKKSVEVLAVNLFNSLLQEIENTTKQTNDLKNAAKAYAHELELLKYKIEDDDSIWGENTIKKMGVVRTKLNEVRKAYADANKEASDFAKDFNKQLSKDVNGTYITATFEDIAKRTEGLGDVMVKTVERTWAGRNLFGLKDQFKSLKKLAPDIFDESGNIIIEKAKAFLDKYSSLWDKGNNAAIKEQIEYLVAYQEQIESLEDTWKDFLTNTFSQLTDDVVDKMIDNFKEFGDAVYDLEEPFESLGETIVTSLLKSMVIDKVLEKYEDVIDKIAGDYVDRNIDGEEMANRLGELTGQIKSDMTGLGDVWNSLLTAFRANGLIGTSDSSSSSASESLSDSIKSITENTASLLASYVNAIRADVSVMRSIQQGALKDIQVSLTQSPTLNDYLQQIQSNTYNNSVNTQAILSELRSVITSAGDNGTAIKVYS